MSRHPAPGLGFTHVKVIALAVTDLARANRFYGELLGLDAAFEGDEAVGWLLGGITLMLKPDWEQPTREPNPRVTLAAADAPATEAALRARGVEIADAVAVYGDFHVGSFIDSEGNKLWFCSPVTAA